MTGRDCQRITGQSSGGLIPRPTDAYRRDAGARAPPSGGSEAAPQPRYESSIATILRGLQRRLLVPSHPIRVGPTLLG